MQVLRGQVGSAALGSSPNVYEKDWGARTRIKLFGLGNGRGCHEPAPANVSVAAGQVPIQGCASSHGHELDGGEQVEPAGCCFQ